jgi:predicted nucleic acid-binding protein
MILYLDTSALLKKYFEEVGSDQIISTWVEATGIVTSSVAYAETMATCYRKKREVDMNVELFKTLLDSFQNDWKSFIRVEVTDELNAVINRIVADYPLRGFDAIHLASALIVHERLPEEFLFACYDFKLLQAAQMENLKTLPEVVP